MKLLLREKRHHLSLFLPWWILRFARHDDEYGPLIDAIYRYGKKELKKYKGLKLVEVFDKDGDYICIRI